MRIKMLVMDVDGTLTDGKLYLGESGELMKVFDCHDGYAIAHILPQLGILPVILSGRSSPITAQRAAQLHITHVYQDVADKAETLRRLAAQLGISPQEIACIGDDRNDLPCMRLCGLSACPAQAVPEVRAEADYVCAHRGGDGAVREWIDVLQQRGHAYAR